MPFKGRVLTEWLTEPLKNHRKMMLIEEIVYIDPYGDAWIAPQGLIINGISYPEYKKKYPRWKNILYTIGSIPIKFFNWHPFVGNARRASVIHDVYCDYQTKSPEATHKMFYQAMLEDGTPRWQAETMYWFVKTFKKW